MSGPGPYRVGTQRTRLRPRGRGNPRCTTGSIDGWWHVSEQTSDRREPDDPMARQSGAVLEDLQPVTGPGGPDPSPEGTVAAPTNPGDDPSSG